MQVKDIDVFLITIFRASLQPYLRLATISMARDTLIQHKEDVMICEKNGLVITNYNALTTHPKSEQVARPIIIYTTTKQ